jgi:hypothetical protein
MIVDELLLERVVRERRFDDRTVEIAKRLFLGNEAPRKVAKEFGLIDKRIYAIRAEVIKQVERYALPEGWSEVTLRGPADVVKATQAFFKRRMNALSAASAANPAK